MLESILGARSKIRILRLFFSDIEREYSIEDVAKGIGLSLGTVHPAMGQLVDSRIIRVRKIGRTKIYVLNRSNRLFEELLALFRNESVGLTKLAFKFTVMSNKKGLKSVILFGSVAKAGYVSEAGDIDLLFICEDELVRDRIHEETSLLSQRFLADYDVVVSPLCLTTSEVRDRMKRSDDFILTTQAQGRLLFGDGEWLGM